MELVSGKYLLDPATGDLWRPLLAAIETRLAKDPQGAGLLELRAELAGQWSDTKAQLADYVTLGKAHAQQGRTNEAAAAFARALALAGDGAGKARIFTEAAPLQGMLEKLVASAGNADRLTFARLAWDQKKFASAARFWSQALASDPKLGDDRQARHRYNAARAAAMAAAGQAHDEPPLDDAAKTTLRRQALDWLKAELDFYRKQLENGKPIERAAVNGELLAWQKDGNLAGLRDAAALAQLPEDEQKAFTQFWADVGELLHKAVSYVPPDGRSSWSASGAA